MGVLYPAIKAFCCLMPATFSLLSDTYPPSQRDRGPR